MKTATLRTMLAMVAFVLVGAAPAAAAGGLNAPICGKCHEEESNKMMGFLKDVSYKANTILMDLLTHREVVSFDDETRVKNLAGLDDMKNYKGKGFRIYFSEEDGGKHAVHVTRFDILQLVDEKDRLDLDAVRGLLAGSGKVTLVDVRPPKFYLAAHIPGAVNVPAPAFEKFKKNLPADKDTTLIVYGVGGCLSPSVAVNAMAEGYDDVKVYTAGYPDWARHEPVAATLGFVVKELPGRHVVVVDVRPEAEFAASHMAGAVSAPAGSLAGLKSRLPEKKNTPIVVVGADADNAARTIISWGYRGVAVLDAGLEQWRKAGGALAQGTDTGEIVYVPRPRPGVMEIADFKKAVTGGGHLIDVRNSDEFAAGHVPGAVNIPLDDLTDNLASLDKDTTYILYCNTGSRAEMAYSELVNHGFKAKYLDALVHFSDKGYRIEEK